jgi:hypothetical protein
MQYELVTHDDLEGLRSTLALLERVMEHDPLELYFYGLSTNTGLLAKANDALEEESETNEEAAASIKLAQVAICVPLSSDTAYYLMGSGLILRRETFAYIAGADGVRTSDLAYSTHAARVTDEDFSEMALSESDSWLDDFLVKHGKRAGATTEAVKRTAPAAATAEPEPNPIDNFLNN